MKVGQMSRYVHSLFLMALWLINSAYAKLQITTIPINFLCLSCRLQTIPAFSLMTVESEKETLREYLRQTPATNPDQIWQTCVNQGATTFRKFWVPSTHRAKWFFVLGNFPTVDFHQIWLRYVNPCPLDVYLKRFSKRFRLGLIPPPQKKSEEIK